jgi:hypothetical protein
MAAPRLVVDLTIEDEDMTRLMAVVRSRTEPASRVERARMLLAYRDDPSFFGVGRLLGVHHQTVQRCSPDRQHHHQRIERTNLGKLTTKYSVT